MIYLVDELVSKPGEGEKLLEAYERLYAAPAKARGQTLAHTLIEPCMWLDDGPNRLMFMWSLPTAQAAWQQKFPNRNDLHIRDVWKEIDAIAASRKRALLGDVDQLAELADV
jgi:hypothetical protein